MSRETCTNQAAKQLFLTLKIKSDIGPRKDLQLSSKLVSVAPLSALTRSVSTCTNMHSHICRSLLQNNFVCCRNEFSMCVKRSSSVFAPSQRCARGIYTIPLPCGIARPVFGQRIDNQCFIAQLCENSAQIRFALWQQRFNAQIAWPNSNRRDRILGRKMLCFLSEIFFLSSFFILSDYKIQLEEYFFVLLMGRLQNKRIQNISDFPLSDRILGTLPYC